MVLSAAAHARPSGVEPPKPKHAGTVPMYLQCAREALANAVGGSDDVSYVTWLLTCSRIVAFIFGLRAKELRSARLSPDEASRLIRLTFHPKGKPTNPRVEAWRWAFGVLGPFQWWPT